MNYNLFLAPEGKFIPSFLVTLFDGTNSMEKEYEAYVQMYLDLCEKAQLNQKLDCQFTNTINPLLPFMKSKIGNLTHSLISLLAYLESLAENLSKYITILLISDGREPFQENDQTLQEKIANLKQNHYFQMIIIQVGKEFPEKTILGLEKMFNNLELQRSTFKIDRQHKQSLQSIKTQFKSAFKSVLHKIFVEEQELQFQNSSNYQIVQTLPLIVKPKTPFICQENEIIYQNQQLQSINYDDQLKNHLGKLIEQGLAFLDEYRRYYFNQLYLLVAERGQIQEQAQLLDFLQKESTGSIITPPQTIENLNQFLEEQLIHQSNQIQVEQEQYNQQNQIPIEQEQEQFGQIINFVQSIYEVKHPEQNAIQNQIQVENDQLDLNQKINQILENYQKDKSRYFQNLLEITILCLKATLDWFKVYPSSEDNEINQLQKIKDLLFNFINKQLEQDAPLVKNQDDYAFVKALNEVFEDANRTIINKDFEYLHNELEKLEGELAVFTVSRIEWGNCDKFLHLKYFEERKNNFCKLKKILIAIFDIDEKVRDIMTQLQIDFHKNIQIPQQELLQIQFEDYEFVKDQKKYSSLIDLMIENQIITSSKDNLKVFLVIFTEQENCLLNINKQKKIMEINQMAVKQYIYSIGVSFYSELNQSFQKKQQNNLNKGEPVIKYIPNQIKIPGIWNKQTSAFVKNYSKEIEEIYLNYKNFDKD